MGMARYKATDRQRAIAADTFILFYFTSLFFRASTEGGIREVKGRGAEQAVAAAAASGFGFGNIMAK